MIPDAYISEIFSSIQGEGLYVGRRQVFVRFCGCNLACRYCDTAGSRHSAPHCRVETQPGSGTGERIANPISAESLSEIVGRFARAARHHSVSLTGGEPLLHADFIRGWLLRMQGESDRNGRPYGSPTAGLPVHLETNGTLPDELAKLIGLIDVVAMDIKLPSVTGQDACISEHLRFLQVAAQRTEVFVKVVFGECTPDSELAEVARTLSRVNHTIPVVLQPLTGPGTPSARQILAAQTLLAGELPNVLVIPQTHKQMRVE
ncbi:MAG TPA: 7-carboxy-7-deazaguanine synthase QueE [Planctomycetota bacterium]|nr:7-carboxy-7-deazaguanine synthase QueE [Planctomycetota bacterium]